MHSKNRSAIQNSERSFIEETRRAQIIQATINVLAQHGHGNATFVRIGKEAGITPSLIAYHFKNKDELTRETLRTILAERAAYVNAQLQGAVTAAEKLRIALEADLDNMSTNIDNFRALAEIIFTIRSEQGTLTYLGENETQLFSLVRTILAEGKRTGEFGDINVQEITIIIDGARDSFLAQLGLRPDFDVDSFKRTLVTFALMAVKKG